MTTAKRCRPEELRGRCKLAQKQMNTWAKNHNGVTPFAELSKRVWGEFTTKYGEPAGRECHHTQGSRPKKRRMTTIMSMGFAQSDGHSKKAD